MLHIQYGKLPKDGSTKVELNQIFHLSGAIAHFERRLIAERIKDGIAAARARGKHPGRQS